MQKFYASKTDTFTSPNGAIGHRSVSMFDCLGPYAKVSNCPIAGVEGLRLTAYATGHANTYFSIPACTRYKGQYIGGYFTSDDDGVKFCPHDRFKDKLAGFVPRAAPKPKAYFYVELTDTFGGEANYCWIKRFKVRASSIRGAILKAARETGYSGDVRKVYDDGNTVRHDVAGACICFFTSAWDECHNDSGMKVI